MKFVITTRDLVKKYHNKEAVKGINFEVREQECFGLLGPNGAGKSSTVKMMYGFSPVTSGTLMVLDMDVRKKAREIKRRIGVVAQENNLDTDLTVLENLLVYASFFDMPSGKSLRQAEELMEFFGISEFKSKKVDTLSGGMKRRLTIARALINSPEILILDESTTGLDPQARHLVWQRLRRLKKQGVTLLLTTHYMDEASQLCDRLLIIDQGRILEQGFPSELVKKHVGDEVLEIGRGAELLEEVINACRVMIKGHLVIGDSLFVYPTDGTAVMEALRPLSHQVWNVFKRNIFVFRKTWKVNLAFNFLEPLLYLSAMGFGLGAYVQPMEGIPYLNYIAPGLIASSAMFSTAYECTYGTFIRMEFQKTYHAIIATPAVIDDVVMGDMLYGAFKSVLYGSVILLVMAALGLVTSPWAILIPPVLGISGMLFAAFSMTWTGLVPNIDSFNYFFSLIITPLFLFSGVFFPLSGMPAVVQQIAWFSPLYHIVNLTRGLVTGNTMFIMGDFIWLSVVTLFMLPLPVYLLRRLVIK